MSEASAEPEEDINSDEDQESEKEYESESEEISRESAEVFLTTQEREAIAKALKELTALSAEIEINSDAYVEVDAADSTYTNSGSDEGSAEHSVDEVESLRRRVREYRQDEIGTQNRKGRFFARSKGIMVILAFASTISAIATVIVAILEAVRTGNNSNPSITPATRTGGLTDSQRKLILSQVMLWRGLDEKTWWAMMSKYCDNSNPSWQAQILTMDTIKKLAAPLNPGWVWRGSDAAEYARALVAAVNGFVPAISQKRSRILYDAVATMTYDRFNDGHLVKLPRQIAADLVELAITELVLGAPSGVTSHE